MKIIIWTKQEGCYGAGENRMMISFVVLTPHQTRFGQSNKGGLMGEACGAHGDKKIRKKFW